MAGINYVLVCTDCHEPHGSPYNRLIRPVINGRDVPTPSSDMGNFCEACHHDGSGAMRLGCCGSGCNTGGCGNASCHLTQVLHRLDKNNVGNGVQMYSPSWACAGASTPMPIKFNLNVDTPVRDDSALITGTEANNPVTGNGYFNGNGASTRCWTPTTITTAGRKQNGSNSSRVRPPCLQTTTSLSRHSPSCNTASVLRLRGYSMTTCFHIGNRGMG